MKTIWQCDAYNRTTLDAIREFCDTYWDKPRTHTKIGIDGAFKLRDGNATYCCELVGPLEGLNRPPVYRIGLEKIKQTQ